MARINPLGRETSAAPLDGGTLVGRAARTDTAAGRSPVLEREHRYLPRFAPDIDLDRDRPRVRSSRASGDGSDTGTHLGTSTTHLAGESSGGRL